LADWEDNGFLTLDGFLSRDEVDAVRAAVDAEWANPAGNDHEIDVLTGPGAGRAYRMCEAPQGARQHAYKLNNLFARRPAIRRIALSPRLKGVLAQLLGGEPLICNSLNFERGSQQEFHIDSWYMPPPVDGNMVAAWFAIDDVDSDNGPLAYYPGSHRIPPYRFSQGRLNEIPEEKPLCRAYLDREIAARGLRDVEFHAKSGDVFIWHGQLLHAGRPIRDMARTRASMVIHYWRACDVPRAHVRVDPASGNYLGHTLRGEIHY
jgi:ectoine hydroxylase-related dioxygenase (phytanoyl-CoA dioxygenase family)